MTSISKLLAFVMFAASAATISALSPSNAQAGRTAIVPPDVAAHPVCCTPATKQVVTGSPGWTLKLPNNSTMTPVQVVPKYAFWDIIPGSTWIANNTTAAATGPDGGTYVYTYHLGCLCDAPKGIRIPATLSLRVYADDEFVAYLNGNPIGQKLGGWAFTTNSALASPGIAAPPGGTSINVTSTYFRPCQDNVLTFAVKNAPDSPTGLDVSGWVSGYFSQPAPGRPCGCGPRVYDPTSNPN